MQAIDIASLASVHGGYDTTQQLLASFKRISAAQEESNRRNRELGVLAYAPIGNLAVGVANKLVPSR